MSYANNIWLIKFDQILDFQQLSSLLHYLVMTKISEALDQYTGICKEAMMTSAAKLSKSIEKVIIEVLLLYSGAVDNAIHLLLAARKLRTCGSPAASMADPRPGKPPRRHHRRTTSSPPPPQLQKISRITSRALKKCWLFRLPPPQAKIKNSPSHQPMIWRVLLFGAI